ncbi:MAG: SusC/RagA family TonB-linked outer membrane protein [Porphyromonadaceae bacterium]|nr:SusC/RagA family TonB-linked outer membrane protein [Porphyromonadaceae bacterium]
MLSISFTYAENTNPQSASISINESSASIKKICNKVEDNSNYVFVFSDEVKRLIQKKINVSINSASIKNVLNETLIKNGLAYEIVGKQIIVYKEKDVRDSPVKIVDAETQNQNQNQKKTISGKVTDAVTGEPIIGASVVEKGTTNGIMTDINGDFKLFVPENSIVSITFIGFVPQEFQVDQKDSYSILLHEEATSLDEVVVIGYGTMKKRDVTGAITSLSNKEIEQKIPVNVFDALQGQVAGVQIVSGSGQPGESSSIKIRGTSTFSAEGVRPLYIVDGIPMEDIDGINPSDIASMEVLKDAASAAIYGSRSANGVIIITTKGGEKGKPKIDVKYLHSWGKLSHKPAQANRLDRVLYDELRREFFLNNNMTANADESIQIIRDSLNVFFNVDNDYINMITQVGQKDQIDLSFGGGENKLRFFINTGYYNERGIIPNTSYNRLTTRVNTDYNPNNWLSVGSRLSLTYSKKSGLNEGDLLRSVLIRRPYFSTHYQDGSIVGVFNGQKNPLAIVYNTTDFTDSYRGNFFQFFEFAILQDLKFRTNINANFYLDKRKRMYPSIITDEWQRNNDGASFNYLNWNWLNENYLSYYKKWGDHNFTAMAGLSAQRWGAENETLLGRNSSTDFIYTMNAFAANLDLGATGTWVNNHSMASLFSRVTYDYLGKYLFTANIRRDGSSRFAKNNKWGNFPSLSVGWRFSDEQFLKFAKPALDDGKIRVSYGVTGNEAIGNYDFIVSIPHSPSFQYSFKGRTLP